MYQAERDRQKCRYSVWLNVVLNQHSPIRFDPAVCCWARRKDTPGLSWYRNGQRRLGTSYMEGEPVLPD